MDSVAIGKKTVSNEVETMTAVDYKKWAEEYERDAEKVSERIKHYKAELKTDRSVEKKDYIRGMIDRYDLILRELHSTAVHLRKRGQASEGDE